MVTKFKDGDKNIRVVTQQYEVGLYGVVYDNDSNVFLYQFGTNMSEEDYHNALREKYKNSLID